MVCTEPRITSLHFLITESESSVGRSTWLLDSLRGSAIGVSGFFIFVSHPLGYFLQAIWRCAWRKSGNVLQDQNASLAIRAQLPAGRWSR